MAELGRNMDEDPYMKDFPFGCILGVTAAVAQVQQWFCVTFGYTRPAGWERNFAEACGIDCGNAKSRYAFDLMVAGYRQALSQWKGGRFLKFFKPKYKEVRVGSVFQGVDKTTLYVDEVIPTVVTPADLYHFVGQALVSPSEIATAFAGERLPDEAESRVFCGEVALAASQSFDPAALAQSTALLQAADPGHDQQPASRS